MKMKWGVSNFSNFKPTACVRSHKGFWLHHSDWCRGRSENLFLIRSPSYITLRCHWVEGIEGGWMGGEKERGWRVCYYSQGLLISRYKMGAE